MLKKVIAFLILSTILTLNGDSMSPVYYKRLSLYYGPLYRFDSNWGGIHSFSIDKWTYISTCANSLTRGYGVDYERQNDQCFSIGVRYFRSRRFIVPLFVGIAPSYFQNQDKWGINISPQLGIFSPLSINKRVGASLSAYYEYDLSVRNAKYFKQNRSSITLKLGIDFDMLRRNKKVK